MTQVTAELEALLMQRSLTDEALEAAAKGMKEGMGLGGGFPGMGGGLPSGLSGMFKKK